jgi:hypothetical protein
MRCCSRTAAHTAPGRRSPLMAASHADNSSMKQQSPGLTGIAVTHGVEVHETSLRMVGPAAAGFILVRHPFAA